MKSSKSSASTSTPSQPMKPNTLLDSERLTRSEIDALRQKKKALSEFVQKELQGTLGQKMNDAKLSN
jgi:hypothetical protein